MNINNEIFDVSAELTKEFGEVGSKSRIEATEKAWEEYNAQILLDARKNAQLTQAELAARIGADKSYISRIERGLTVPTVATLYKIVAAMGLTIELKPIN
ncbi:MAG: helix-turn-helix transcriptional regulator [Bacteroidaceae bacterium]|mgnify:CR=1|nr:helix-turn-helix transcriptional regulator [Bacteroidaceae bacterium]